MKQKIILIISTLFLLFSFLLPNKVLAISSSGGYTIESYNIYLNVNEDNTFDIIEVIEVNFTDSNKHGIFRKIPLKNSVTRLDGSTSTNNAKISNISVSDKYTTSNENGYTVIKIGSAYSTVSGKKKYTIQYTYNIGKDPLKDADELYFNLIGTEWDTNINNVNFTITMPKPFDETNLGFSSGYKTSLDNSNISYTVTGNTIKGSLTNTLDAHQALTVRLTLPEGYFVGASSNFDYMLLFKILTSIVFVIIAFIIWKKHGKEEKVIDTVEFYPPEGINSAELGFIYKGHSEQKDIISLLIYLANKGYLKIEEIKNEAFKKILKFNDFKIIKLKEYDGDNENERLFFNELFMGKKSKNQTNLDKLKQSPENLTVRELYEIEESSEGDNIYEPTEEVTKSDLYNRFYLILNKIQKNMNRKENKEKIFEKTSLMKRILVMIMISILFLFIGGLSMITQKEFAIFRSVVVITLGLLIVPWYCVYKYPGNKSRLASCICYILIGLICLIIKGLAGSEGFSASLFIEIIIENICMLFLIISLSNMRKRTEYGREMLGKIQGFKKFLEMAEKPKLEQLVMENPEYFYNILPYTYVLGVSEKWMKIFENIALEAPSWYNGDTNFSIYSFNSFMDSTYTSLSNMMTSISSGTSSDSSSFGGSSSGGGFSGGGSGGGGGGSW